MFIPQPATRGVVTCFGIRIFDVRQLSRDVKCSYRVQPQGAAAVLTGNDSLLSGVGVALDDPPPCRTASQSATCSPVTMATVAARRTRPRAGQRGSQAGHRQQGRSRVDHLGAFRSTRHHLPGTQPGPGLQEPAAAPRAREVGALSPPPPATNHRPASVLS